MAAFLRIAMGNFTAASLLCPCLGAIGDSPARYWRCGIQGARIATRGAMKILPTRIEPTVPESE
jgi:hypothetical protein